MRVIIAAAGTAGHINPGIAIANKIKEEESNSQIIFLGTSRGLEKDLVSRAGYELKTIDAYGLSKKISIDSIKNLFKTYKGIGQANKIVKEFKPDIIIGTGGYICGAAILAGKKNNIPTILHESNALPGKAVRMLSKKVDKILLGFEDAVQKLDEKEKLVVTGTPVKIRDLNLSDKQKEQKLKQLAFSPNKPLILIFGGSQGAKRINDTVFEIIKQKLNNNYQIIWATGPTQYDNIVEQFKKENIDIETLIGVKVLPYIYNMEEIMNIASVLVCRSGAMTVTEISKLGKPAIFIPLPNVSENHQEYNARTLEKLSAARVILDSELNANILNENINSVISNRNNLEQMGINARLLSISNVEDRIYDEITKLVNK